MSPYARMWLVMVVGVIGSAVVMPGEAAARPKAAPKAKPTPKAPAPVRSIPADLPPPKPEARPQSAGAFPAVPSFELTQEPGFVSPRYLRVKRTSLLDTKVKAKGYIVWIYNCVDAIRRPKESKAKVQKRIDADPTLCERPKFYLGDTKTTPAERALWVVDVPRPPNKLEKTRLPKEDLKNWPKVPKFKVGDFVVVGGDFKVDSPHGERNSDGLLVFEAIEPAKPAGAPAAAPSAPAAPAAAPWRTPPVPALAPIEPKRRGESVAALATGNAALAKHQYPEANRAYRAAIKAWAQNHLAWYGLGGSLAGSGDWPGAFDAFERARALRPDAAMYQLWAGVAAYERVATVAGASGTGAAGEFDVARDRLRAAIALNSSLWRAHYYLGRVYRAADDARRAAEAFTEAARITDRESGPFIALVELYRKWDYMKEALEVATIGTTVVPPKPEASDVWFVLGMARDDTGDLAGAADAFTQALVLKPSNAKAQFQRGQAYYKLANYGDATTDLEGFMNTTDPALEFARQQAQKMLFDIAAKQPAKKK